MQPEERQLSSNAKPARDSNLELLRIVCIILIILHHYSIHGASSYNSLGLSPATFFLQLLMPLGKIGVNCFILTSGYYLSKSTIKPEKIVKLYTKTWLYSVGIFLLFTLTGLNQYSNGALLHSALPITYNSYWFISTYLFLLLLSPIINRCIETLSQREHLSLISGALAIWCIWPTFLQNAPEFSHLIWFIVMYFTGGYIQRHRSVIPSSPRFWKLTLLGGVLAYITPVLALDILSSKLGAAKDASHLFFDINKIPTVLISISLFAIFLNAKQFHNKFINWTAKFTLGIYIIHDNAFIQPLLWKNLFNNSTQTELLALVQHAILSTAIVFSACIVIDLICSKIAHWLFGNLSERVYTLSEQRIKRGWTWLLQRLTYSS